MVESARVTKLADPVTQVEGTRRTALRSEHEQEQTRINTRMYGGGHTLAFFDTNVYSFTSRKQIGTSSRNRRIMNSSHRECLYIDIISKKTECLEFSTSTN